MTNEHVAPTQPEQNAPATEAVRSPEDMSYDERNRETLQLVRDVQRRRQEYIARAINTRRATA